MSINAKLQEFLEENEVKWDASEHPLAYTASETAHAQHVPGDQLLKPVVVTDGDQFWMCVVSAAQKVDFDKLKKILGGNKDLQLASEEQIIERFPDFEPGAEPPFGQFGNMDLLMDAAIEDLENVVFNGGTHTDAVQIALRDYERLAKPEVAEFARHL